MLTIHRFARRAFVAALWAGVLLLPGCGGGNGSSTALPLSVYMPISTVTVVASGPSVSVPIQIGSTSETALVAIAQLPGGVTFSYSASDTNPSGTLTFTANSMTKAGTYMPVANVNSAGQVASLGFNLIVGEK